MGEIWEQLFTDSQGMPEAAVPRELLSIFTAATTHSNFPKGNANGPKRQRTVEYHLSVCVFIYLSRTGEGADMPIAYGNTRIPFLLCKNDSSIQRRVCCPPAQLSAHQNSKTHEAEGCGVEGDPRVGRAAVTGAVREPMPTCACQRAELAAGAACKGS